MNIIRRDDWVCILEEISDLMIKNKSLLTEIDAKFGDGDHGITIEKIGLLIADTVSKWKDEPQSLKQLFESIGYQITNVNGGSAGPLYGTYFSGLGEILDDEVEVDAKFLKKMFDSGLTELQYLTNAKVGDKTMMDTLIPATKAALAAEDTIESIVKEAFLAAQQGAKDSEQFVSKFGRARNYKEKTIGTPDAGAQSCTYIFEGFYNTIIK